MPDAESASPPRRRRTGFTPAGVLLIGAAVGSVVAFARWWVPKPTHSSGDYDYRRVRATTTVANVRTAVRMYRRDAGVWPTRIDDLLAAPAGVTGWQGPYLKRDPELDPWGSPYELVPVAAPPGSSGTPAYEAVSRGPDGELGTEDDVRAPE